MAIVLMVIGGGLWGYAVATAPPAQPAATSRSVDSGSHLATGLAASDSSGSATTTPAEPRLIDDAAPAVFRLGASFLGGFFLGYFTRKFLRWGVILLAIIAVAIFLLRQTEIIHLPWDQIEGEVREGATWVQARIGGLREVATGYLPSTAAAIIGGLIGFMRG